MPGFEVTGEAVLDLALIWSHLANAVSIRAADEALERIDATLHKTIARHPRTGRLRPELGAGVCSFPIPPYVVFYQLGRHQPRVLRVLHGHRDIRPPLTSLLAAV